MTRAPAAVQVDGLRRLTKELRRAGADMVDLKDANAEVAALVADRGATLAPRRSGTLAGSGRGNRAAGRASVKFGSAAVRYARPIHWGWEARNIAAHPFVVVAAEDTQPQWMDLYAANLQQIADSVAGRY